MVKSGRGWYINAACKDMKANIFMSHDPEGIKFAKSVCDGCGVKVQCKKAYGSVDCIAGGTTLLERLLESWKRIENEQDSNWK